MLSLAASLALSCSGRDETTLPTSGGALDGERVVPRTLEVVERPGGCGVLKATALTLKSGASGLELYAALRNQGDEPACGASFSVQLFDPAEQSVAAGVGGLLVTRFFRLVDGSETLAACLAPGDVTLIALEALSTELVPEGVKRVEYWCNYWALEVAPVGRLEVSPLERVGVGNEARYTGVLHNDLDQPVATPAVAVFPLTEAGRPLGIALAEGTEALQPGGRWAFATNTAGDAGATALAFPTRGP